MNFLGHLLVSGEDPLVITGNFMGDAVKGRDLSHYPPRVQKGLRMHRAIDTFTDNHALALRGRERLRSHAGKYAGVVLDIFIDHALASQWAQVHPGPEDLRHFAQRMYGLLTAHAPRMPERTRGMLSYMVQHDWLTSYAHIDGIARALQGLSTRPPGGSVMVGAERLLEEHLHEYRSEGLELLADLRQHLQHHDQG